MTSISISALSSNNQRSLISPRQIAGFLLASDILGFLFCTHVSLWIRLGETINFTSPIFYAFGLAILLGLYLANAYRPYENIAGLWSPSRVAIANVISAIIICALLYFSGVWHLSPLAWRSVLFPTLLMFTIWSVGSRQILVAKLKNYARKSSWLVVGQGELIDQFCQDFQEFNPYVRLSTFSARGDLVPVAVTSNNSPSPASEKEWEQVIAQSYSGIVIHPKTLLTESQIRQLMHLRLNGSVICQLPDFYEIWWQRVPPATLHDTWFTFGAGFDLITGRFGLKVKRLADILAALSMLILLAPVMILAAIAVKLDTPGPIFYSQLRNGRYRKPFLVYKFRSMCQNAEQRGAQWAQERDPRITRVGNFLRLTRIDELPQIWNVLVGDMSLIGPRPERPQFDETLAEEIPYYNLRYLVKPGITGWAQVMYPYGASVKDSYEKLSYDLYYIKNHSLWLDISIVFKTIRVVFLGKGR